MFISKKVSPILQKGLSAFCIFVGAAVFAVWCMVFPAPEGLEEMERDAMIIQSAVQNDLAENGTGRIYLLMSGNGWENSYVHHRIFYDLISEKINIANGFEQTQVAVPGLEKPAEVWAEELQKGYDYVYILSMEDSLIPIFKELSSDKPAPYSLYRVILNSGRYGVSLQKVNGTIE